MAANLPDLVGPSTIINGVPSKVRVDIPRDEARPSEVPSARCDCGCEFRLLTVMMTRGNRILTEDRGQGTSAAGGADASYHPAQ